LADDYQNKGIGSVIFPYLLDVEKKFGQKRIILWGGVLCENQRAIRYYEKNGFQRLGEFKNSNHQDCVDMIFTL
jgi:GNAT superfamily N-acetyltransferase